MEHLDNKNILVDIQHGFRARRSCETQLIQTVHDFAQNLDNKIQTDVAVLDFKKAFDKVSHSHLLYKLQFYGIRGDVRKWIENFLANRTQRVIVDGQASNQISVTSGVPQGSVLGPILFLIFINDIGENLNSKARLFADDCLLYRSIESPTDCALLQEDLNTLLLWAATWKMECNISKCFIMHISHLPERTKS
jgi:retron-type reverse transcriptase